MIHAKYSRLVIDLNRNPESKPLYTDGRIITELVPKTDFLGDDIYVDKKFFRMIRKSNDVWKIIIARITKKSKIF